MAKKKTTKKTVRKRGRPSAFKKEFIEQAYKLCLLGYTNDELASFFKVAVSTIGLWIKNNSEFSDAVIEGKTLADANVAKSFHKRAVGYKYKEKHKERYKGEMRLKKVITKEVVPDAGAALNWLKNRQPELWRDKQDIKQEIKHDLPEGAGVMVTPPIQSFDDWAKMNEENNKDLKQKQEDFDKNA